MRAGKRCGIKPARGSALLHRQRRLIASRVRSCGSEGPCQKGRTPEKASDKYEKRSQVPHQAGQVGSSRSANARKTPGNAGTRTK
jgi:hypothetical protein